MSEHDLVTMLREMAASPSRNHEYWLAMAADEIESLRHDVTRGMANHNADLNQKTITRTDEELATKLRGYLNGAASLMGSLGERDYEVVVKFTSDDAGQWTGRVLISKTVML